MKIAEEVKMLKSDKIPVCRWKKVEIPSMLIILGVFKAFYEKCWGGQSYLESKLS